MTDNERALMKSDPLYAIGYEHGLEGLINAKVDSAAYFAGQKAGSEARAAFTEAGFRADGGGVFSLSVGTPRKEKK